MDNNKNRMKDQPKSNQKQREMKPKENADLRIIDGQKIGLHQSGHKKSTGDKG